MIKVKIYSKPEEFKKRRLERGYSVGSLAMAVGKGESYMSRIQNSRTSISSPLAHKIAEKLKCTFDDVFTIKEA